MTVQTRDWHSTVNQRIVGKLVEREVLCNVSMLMEHLFKTAERTEYYDELMNLGSRDDWEAAWDNAGKKILTTSDGDKYIVAKDYVAPEREPDATDEEYVEACDDDLDCEGVEYDGEDDDYEALCRAADIDPETCDVLEHWVVSSWFAGKLEEQGEAVEEVFNLNIWGRTCSGQAILLDGVVCRIAENMEILDGQKNSWKD